MIYVFAKQIEEAGMLVLNKRDLVSPDRAHEALEQARGPLSGQADPHAKFAGSIPGRDLAG